MTRGSARACEVSCRRGVSGEGPLFACLPPFLCFATHLSSTARRDYCSLPSSVALGDEGDRVTAGLNLLILNSGLFDA